MSFFLPINEEGGFEPEEFSEVQPFNMVFCTWDHSEFRGSVNCEEDGKVVFDFEDDVMTFEVPKGYKVRLGSLFRMDSQRYPGKKFDYVVSRYDEFK
jgi:hypothetical protein